MSLIEQDQYSKAWAERNEAKEAQEAKVLYEARKAILDNLLPGISFKGDDIGGYEFSIDGNRLDMNFKNFNSLKEAASIVARMKLIYEKEFENTGEKPYFFSEKGSIFINDGIILDTKYLSFKHSEKFIGPGQDVVGEMKKVAEFMNKVLNIPVEVN